MATMFEAGPIDPHTELDMHTNMVVLSKHCFIFDHVQGRTCKVAPYDPSIGTTKEVPVVVAAIAYDCPYTHEAYVLIVRKALHFPSMDNNLIPPFILCEAGLTVKDTSKIHVQDPDHTNHAISFPDNNLKIPLQLHRIFSYFHSRVPMMEEVSHKDPIFLTPDSDNWNLHSEHFAQNKDSMFEWERNMNPKKACKEHVLDLNMAVDLLAWENTVDEFLTGAFDA